jgi:hypothetical protein
MKKFLLIFLIMLIAPSFAVAKRAHPPVVEVNYKGIRFVADRFNLGYINAYDVETNKKVWEKKVYESGPFDDEIPDIPFAYIVSLSIKDGKLLVVDMKNNKYKVVIPKEILRE